MSSSDAHGQAAEGDFAIRCERLTKRYHLFPNPRARLFHALTGRSGPCAEVPALSEVSFEVRRGEVVGIIGRNGSGKSTLLQILSGVLEPTSGQYSVHGRMAALLELGAGFNPEFSGIENVFLNAAILGLTRAETDERLPAILEFAGIGEYVHQPVKTYSSGMFVRLAFAVAACVDPDILVVDEALAVGDLKFQSRCFRHFERMVQQGKTIVLVTHSIEQVVRHCHRAILLDGGQIRRIGDPLSVTNEYREMLFGAPEDDVAVDRPAVEAPQDVVEGSHVEERAGYCATEYRWGSGGAAIRDVLLRRARGGGHVTRFESGERVVIELLADVLVAEEPIFGFFIKTPDGVTVYGNSTRSLASPRSESVAVGPGRYRLGFECTLHLGHGQYFLSVGVAAEREGEIVPLDRRYDLMHFEIANDSGAAGVVELNASFSMIQQG